MNSSINFVGNLELTSAVTAAGASIRTTTDIIEAKEIVAHGGGLANVAAGIQTWTENASLLLSLRNTVEGRAQEFTRKASREQNDYADRIIDILRKVPISRTDSRFGRILVIPDAVLHTADLGFSIEESLIHQRSLRAVLRLLVLHHVQVPEILSFLEDSDWPRTIRLFSIDIRRQEKVDQVFKKQVEDQIRSLVYSINTRIAGGLVQRWLRGIWGITSSVAEPFTHAGVFL